MAVTTSKDECTRTRLTSVVFTRKRPCTEELTNCYGISVLQMTTYMFRLSLSQSLPTFAGFLTRVTRQVSLLKQKLSSVNGRFRVKTTVVRRVHVHSSLLVVTSNQNASNKKKNRLNIYPKPGMSHYIPCMIAE